MMKLAFAALVAGCTAQDEMLTPSIIFLPEHDVAVNATSGKMLAVNHLGSLKGNTILLWDQVLTPEAGANQVQLIFDPSTLLSDDDVDAATLKIWSEYDGAAQMLNAHTIRQWGFRSAMFNGDTVHVQLLATPEAGVTSVSVIGAHVMDGTGEAGSNTLCGTVDNRRRSTSRKEARYVPGGYCSAGLVRVGTAGHNFDGCLLTAGHCTGNGGRVEFNVPDSSNTGQVRSPGPEDQYSIDSTSIAFTDGGVGNDWKTIGPNPNSNTGRTALQTQGISHQFDLDPLTTVPPSCLHDGHGSTSPANNLYLVNKGTPGGSTTCTRTTNTIRYRFDTTGGDSGSAVTRGPAATTYYAIHTHGGCAPGSPTSSNAGTWAGRPEVLNAVRNGRGVCSRQEVPATERYGIHFRGDVHAFEGPRVGGL